MRVVSHTCSNTEIVCALGCADLLIAVDNDSDFPPEVVGTLPQLGRDLNLDIDAVCALKPDLVLTSLTVPGHERVVAEIAEAGLPHRIIDPHSLDDVFASILEIAEALGVPERGAALVQQMQTAMPPIAAAPNAPRILVEWWPKPVIGAARQSWVHDLIERAGGLNALSAVQAPTLSCDPQQAPGFAVDAVAMSWCGVQVEKYRADVVLQRPGWQDTGAIRQRRVHAISEAYLGRPGPRLVEGYRALRWIVESIG
ncbi:ABC transporter substrate-binding protein [Sinimarinibacterium sp. CAU 1509]|uniref:ABC transporter substrate-binding protein n=1 Tax=Sinimarinibacterium sp. CAU 1509 TaxID=2562283 RepID=UPI0010AD2D3A|nr:helical backbone metal receptor [Sinimarinibacterium sp. CAU 1509]TJY65151.1 ABC transporter substrate-binding protein [Sinimarinibacterium sp. CAU 1509]